MRVRPNIYLFVGPPTIVLTVSALAFGVYPLIGYLLWSQSKDPVSESFLGIPLTQFRDAPLTMLLPDMGIALGAYLLFLRVLPNAWMWFHTYFLSAATSCMIIWIMQNKLAAIGLPHVPVIVQVGIVLLFRYIYGNFIGSVAVDHNKEYYQPFTKYMS